DKQTLGLVYPDDRQAVSRWLAFTKKFDTPIVSPYLRAAARRAGTDGQIVMALDLSDVAQPHRLAKTLKDSQVLQSKKANLRAVTEVVRSLRGVTLVIDVGTQAVGEFRVEFGKDVAVLKPFAKELVLETLERVGASVADPNRWKVTME